MTYPIQSEPTFPGSRNWVSCQTQSLWLNNAVQCRRPTGRFRIAAAAWTHEGTYLIYGFLAPISDQGIPVEYELDTFNTPPQEQLYVTPKIGYVDVMLLFRSRHLALNSPLGHFNRDNLRLSPKSTRHTKLTVTPRFISSNGNMAFAKLRRTESIARPTTRAVFSTLSYLHFVSLLTTRLAAQKQTKYSMLQIKAILKNTFRLRHLELSPLYT